MHPENLYSAIYSGVPVYEFINPKSSVMRRKKDGWINATHILKVADFPKAKRTRILEKDVQVDLHEKVQGGYGKYQGTWVPMEKALQLAIDFNVLDELKPLFEYESSNGSNSPPLAPKHHHISNKLSNAKTNNAKINKLTNSKASKRSIDKLDKLDDMISPNDISSKQQQTKKKKSKTHSKDVINAHSNQQYNANNNNNVIMNSNNPSNQQQRQQQQQFPNMSDDSNESDDDSDFDYDSDDQLSKQQQRHPKLYSQDQSRNSNKSSSASLSAPASAHNNNNNNNYNNNYSNHPLMNVNTNLIGNNSYLPQYQQHQQHQQQQQQQQHQQHQQQQQLQHHHLKSQQLQQVQSNVNDSTLSPDFMSDTDLDNALKNQQNINNKRINIYKIDNNSNNQKLNNQLNSPYQLNQNQNFNNLMNSANTTSSHLKHSNSNDNSDESNSDKPFSQDEKNKIYTQKLLEYFLSTGDGITINNDVKIPDFITNPLLSSSSTPPIQNTFDLNQIIDKDGNTTFHWACAMGDLKMCDALLTRDCNFRCLNNQGEVPIMRSVMYTNSYTRRTFAKLLDLLNDTILDSDSFGKTILHHIAIATVSSANLPSSRYYTEILLTKIAENITPIERIINFINHQDSNGNTAFHIFANNNATKCIKILLSYNARVDIPNNKNEFVSDYLYKYNTNLNYYDDLSSSSFNNNNTNNNSLSNNQSYNPNHLLSNSHSIMKPFNPNLNGIPITHSQSTTPVSHSMKSPSILGSRNSIYNHNYHLNNNENHLMSYGHYFGNSLGSYLSQPHYSESAMQVNQRSSELFEKLNDLSNSFDNELLSKNNDLEELKNIIKQMDEDINKYKKDIDTIVHNVFGDKNDDKESKQINEENKENENRDDIKSGSSLETDPLMTSTDRTSVPAEEAIDEEENKKTDHEPSQSQTQSDSLQLTQDDQVEKIDNEYSRIEEIYFQKTNTLRRLIERSQAKDLASVVSEKESEAVNANSEKVDEDNLAPSKLNIETVTKILELIKLQMIRRRTVDELVTIYADASENTEVVNQYRRLVSKLSNVAFFEVDESLDDIEACLKFDMDVKDE